MGVIISLEKEMEPQMLKIITQFCDKVMEVE
jgi:hypothetical protein